MTNKLCVVSNVSTVETDHTADAANFKRDTFTVDLNVGDFIYVGFYKVINALYFHMATKNTVASSLDFEYFSETGWKALEVCDDTKALTRDGFITWDRPSDAVESVVMDEAKCWVRFSPNDDIDAIEFQAINLLFSDDNDLCEVVPGLIDPCFYPAGSSSHILQHVAAKNYIMSRLKSLGYVKQTQGGEENITQWDILDIHELRLASVYYTISQVYFNLSDDPDDQYWAKSREYDAKFEEAFALGRLRVDLNDDGQVDTVEKRPLNSVRWVR